MLRSNNTLRDSSGFVRSTRASRAPAAVAIELGRKGVVFLGQPGETAETVLDFHHRAGFGGERGLERHDLVAMSGLLPRVAAVDASAQISRAPNSGCQVICRGPVGTPWRGTSSETGRSATVATGRPFESQTSDLRAK